jgi:hypothetical protein
MHESTDERGITNEGIVTGNQYRKRGRSDRELHFKIKEVIMLYCLIYASSNITKIKT